MQSANLDHSEPIVKQEEEVNDAQVKQEETQVV